MAKEGRKIKTIDPMNIMVPYIMPDRTGASNLFEATVDITNAEKYLREKRAGNCKNIGMMHVFMAAYVRMVSQMPGINRFIRGQRIYARNGIEMNLTIKKEMTLEAQETVVKIPAIPTDTLEDIYNKVNVMVTENKQEGDRNGMDSTARFLSYVPGLFLKFIVWFLKTLDYFGLLPKAILKVSPFHGSMFITNMGSLGIDPVYHHLYNFGNIPVFISMGRRKTYMKINENGEESRKKVMGLTAVCDERICDGNYYAQAFKLIKKYIENPWLLDKPPEKVIEDIR
ncbi:MAG: 2-oxo acid dehydrogenase subunit E2 [Bacillota bacterium]|nr:2-oxo acid dehydrogenase subunit E2 [Bacillota bacterium]